MTDAGTAIHDLPMLPRDRDGPVFKEPWEAQAFALAVRLSEIGCFTWSEWAAVLNQEIKAAQARGDPDLGGTYYRHWLSALERICVDKGLVGRDAIHRRTEAWRRAYLRTPHGQPVSLSAACREAPGHG
jgi:nitrile hydratase accessory protein